MGLIKYCKPSSPTKKVSIIELLLLVAAGFKERQDEKNINNKNTSNRVIVYVYVKLISIKKGAIAPFCTFWN